MKTSEVFKKTFGSLSETVKEVRCPALWVQIGLYLNCWTSLSDYTVFSIINTSQRSFLAATIKYFHSL